MAVTGECDEKVVPTGWYRNLVGAASTSERSQAARGCGAHPNVEKRDVRMGHPATRPYRNKTPTVSAAWRPTSRKAREVGHPDSSPGRPIATRVMLSRRRSWPPTVTPKFSTETLHGFPDSKEDAKRVFIGPQTELVQGTLSPNELKTLVTLLQGREFRTLSRSTGGIVLKGGETFVAVVPRVSGEQRVVASDRDGENPFPRSVQGIVSWLWQFKPEGATPLDVSAQDVCPQGAVQPVNPNNALLRPTS
jgi:hypothetical protein